VPVRRLPAFARRPHLPDTVLAVSVFVLDLAFFSEIGGNLDNTPRGSQAPIAVIAFAAAGAAPLPWRRAPIVVFGLVWAHAMLGILVRGYQPFLGLLVSLYSVGVYLSARHAWTAAAALVPYSLVSWDQVRTEVEPGDQAIAMGSLVFFYVLLTAGAWALGFWARHGRRRVADLEQSRLRAIADERSRIARELHDIVAHSVTVIVLQAAGAQQVIATDRQRATEALGNIQLQGKQAMSELRRMLQLLHASEDSSVDDRNAGDQPDVADLAQLIEAVRHTGLPVTLQIEGEPGRLDPSVALAAYRVVQEALTNVAKHADGASSVSVRVTWSDELRVEVVNDGVDRSTAVSPELSTGHGLIGLRERVTVTGGRFEAGPGGEGTFRVTAALPRTGD
jgi:signal transduction histidine kinase